MEVVYGCDEASMTGADPRRETTGDSLRKDQRALQGRIFNIQRFSTEDGPGIRTTIFLKGCPLACLWCSNPESQKTKPELAHSDVLCNRCGHCVTTCSRQAIVVVDNGVQVNRELCDDCGECVAVCATRALRMMGDVVSVEQVFDEVIKDRSYYRNSRGGVTCSGGEPLQQAEFVAALFQKCQAAGIHTTLDTCGYSTRRSLERVLECTDLFLFDIKMIDDRLHRETTGVSNKLILENARRVAGSGKEMIVRVPLIPDASDTDENIAAIAEFVRTLRAGMMVNVLPYHRFGMNKFDMLDRTYPMGDAKPLAKERVTEIVGLFRSCGLPCEVIT